MSQPAARIADMHTCPMQNPGVPPIPHVGGPILPPGEVRPLIGGLPAARVGDMCVCTGPPDPIVKGSMAVLIGGRPAARMGDVTAHGGTIVGGFPKVLIGDQGSGGGGGGGAGVVLTSQGTPGSRVSQRDALTGAAESGAAFCEPCERARLAEANASPRGNPSRQALESAADTGMPFCAECEAPRRAEAVDGASVEVDRATLGAAARSGDPIPEAR